MNTELLKQHLLNHDVRPTKPRLLIAQYLFDEDLQKEKFHFTVADVFQHLVNNNTVIAFASVYNVIHAFVDAGLLAKISIPHMDANSIYYDTNTSAHYHLIDEQSGKIEDIQHSQLQITGIADIEKSDKYQVDLLIRKLM